MSADRFRVVVLISGRGSNLQAIIDQTLSGDLPIEMACVISNRPNAQGLERAAKAGIETAAVDHTQFSDRQAFESALIAEIDRHQPQLVVLAGFMRVLSAEFVRHYANRMINIHPSLLPAFPGLHTHERAIEANAAQHGASVHFVTPEVDAGPIIIQATVPIKTNDTPELLAARVLEQEHHIYPLAVRWLAENRLSIENNQVLLDGRRQKEQGLQGD
ncbi:MAG: phosphoribosylglycinamide formyltransferase [Proteobacteria bacterium]|nr:phosphoribosylglycinamide formyltransferase [Pseudomonadota bacterium]